MSIFYDEEEPIFYDDEEQMPVKKNDPSKNTVSVGYNGKDNIIVTIMNEDNEPIATATLDYRSAHVVNSLLKVAIETLEFDKGIVKELIE